MANCVVLTGRLVRDPERRVTSNQTSVASFSIAVDDQSQGANRERNTLFLDVSAFGKTADNIIKFKHKGDMVAVVGRLVEDKYTRRSDNVEIRKIKVLADRVEFISSGKRDASDSGYTSDAPAPASISDQTADKAEGSNLDGMDIAEDDLPF